MTNVDQFESVFRSADKAVFAYEPIPIETIIIVTDLSEADAYALSEDIKKFLSVLSTDRSAPAWDVVTGSEFDSIESLLELVGERTPGLICTYRHLHSMQWEAPYSLGDYTEVLTQATTAPVLVLPHPQAKRALSHALHDTNTVMAMTDHLTGDNRLVNFAARFTEPDGTLFLTHVEDDAVFDRYIDAISKIPEIDTDVAHKTIHDQLLKSPRDFIHSCRDVLANHRTSMRVNDIVTMGHRLTEYRRLIEDHAVDLLVMNTKDEDQLAMHGLAYPLAVELREIPLLLL